MTTPRSNPCPVEVKVYRQCVKDNAITDVYVKTVQVFPPHARMTEAEFNAESETHLQDVPPEFHSAISYKAYEDGHSSGYEEVINYVQELCHWLKEPLAAYTARVLARPESAPGFKQFRL